MISPECILLCCLLYSAPGSTCFKIELASICLHFLLTDPLHLLVSSLALERDQTLHSKHCQMAPT